MLYDYFSLCQYIIEDLKISTCIIYANTSSTHSDIIYKCEGSSNDDGDKGGSGKDDRDEEEESFEIEEEIADIKRLIKLSNDAMILDEKLPYSHKEKNSHLNNLRKDPHVKEFFEGKTPNASDLPELNKALVEAKKEKRKELSEAKNYADDEPSTNSLRDESNSSFHESNSSFHESNNTFKKEDYNDYSDYKLENN
jgi:Sec-independent protein translocase protein TatA